MRPFEIDDDDEDQDEEPELYGGLDPHSLSEPEVFDPRELARLYGRGSKHRH